ncbi:MAG: hypothetical protein H8E13_19140 [Actinobacteria bacterium]|nr:hypothetical protein [Actinomycetota bacterium]
MAIVNMKSNLSQINKDYKIIVNKESNIDKQYDIMSDHEIRENSKKGLPSLFSQPYIIRKPNDPLRKSKMLDSRIFPIGSAADDIFRIGK